MTMRADGQFNTTIYTEDDRFRGIHGGRYVIFMNSDDIDAEGLKSGDTVTLVDGGRRRRRTSAQRIAGRALRYSAQGALPAIIRN